MNKDLKAPKSLKEKYLRSHTIALNQRVEIGERMLISYAKGIRRYGLIAR